MTETSTHQVALATTESQLNNKRLLLALIGVCCVGFLIADLCLPFWLEEEIPALLAIGVMTAQLTAICLWGTLVHGAFWIRLPWTLLLLVLSWCAISTGFAIQEGSFEAEVMFMIGFFWTIGFVTSFVPLKIVAVCFGWQITQRDQADGTGKNSSRYAIRDMMIGTMLLAATMAVVRFLIAGQDTSVESLIQETGLYDPEPWIVTAIFGIVSLVVKLPCIWISLRQQGAKILQSIGCWSLATLGLSIGELILFESLFGGPGVRRDWTLYIAIILSHQVMGLTILAVGLALRGIGYRLTRLPLKGVRPL